MVADPGRFQTFLSSQIDNKKITFMIEKKNLKCNCEVKLLGITIDDKLFFNKHLRALIRIRKFLSTEKIKYLSKVYMSAFKYCPLFCMFCGKAAINAINKIHKRILRIIYEMEDASSENSLNSLKVTSSLWMKKNIQKLLIEIYKSMKNISPPIMQEFYNLNLTPYNLRMKQLVKLPKTITSKYGIQALCFKKSLLWKMVPIQYKNTNLENFKRKIEVWKPTTCICKVGI